MNLILNFHLKIEETLSQTRVQSEFKFGWIKSIYYVNINMWTDKYKDKSYYLLSPQLIFLNQKSTLYLLALSVICHLCAAIPPSFWKKLWSYHQSWNYQVWNKIIMQNRAKNWWKMVSVLKTWCFVQNLNVNIPLKINYSLIGVIYSNRFGQLVCVSEKLPFVLKCLQKTYFLHHLAVRFELLPELTFS